MPHRISQSLLAGALLWSISGNESRGQDLAPLLDSLTVPQAGGLGGIGSLGSVLPLQAEAPDKQPGIKLPRENLAAVPIELTMPIGMPIQNRPVFEKLESRRISLDVRNVPLTDVLSTVRDQAGCNVLMNKPALEEEGVNEDTPITARLTDAPVDRGLKRLLQPYNLTYVVTHSVLMITSQLDAGNDLTFQVYPVADLVWTGGVEDANAVSFDSLIGLLEHTVSPNTWSRVGGAGSVRPFSANLSLAINQTQAAHSDIVNVLTALRQARSGTEAEKVARPAHVPPKSSIHPTAVGVNQRESELVRAANELVVSLSFDKVPLGDVLHFISEHSKLPIDINKPALEEEGINADTPISIEVSNVALGDALHLLLGQYNLTWLVKNDVIQITSQLDAANELRTLCYPVGDLVVLSSDTERWSVFHGELQQLLQDVISPNSWSSVGGAGAMHFFAASQCLAVSQTDSVHAQIAALLTTLREASDRLPAITRAAGMPTPQRLVELRLREVLAAAERVRQESNRDD